LSLFTERYKKCIPVAMCKWVVCTLDLSGTENHCMYVYWGQEGTILIHQNPVFSTFTCVLVKHVLQLSSNISAPVCLRGWPNKQNFISDKKGMSHCALYQKMQHTAS